MSNKKLVGGEQVFVSERSQSENFISYTVKSYFKALGLYNFVRVSGGLINLLKC